MKTTTAAALAAALAGATSAPPRNLLASTPIRPSGVRGRNRSPGNVNPAGSKLARKAAKGQIGVRS